MKKIKPEDLTQGRAYAPAEPESARAPGGVGAFFIEIVRTRELCYEQRDRAVMRRRGFRFSDTAIASAGFK